MSVELVLLLVFCTGTGVDVCFVGVVVLVSVLMSLLPFAAVAVCCLAFADVCCCADVFVGIRRHHGALRPPIAPPPTIPSTKRWDTPFGDECTINNVIFARACDWTTR